MYCLGCRSTTACPRHRLAEQNITYIHEVNFLSDDYQKRNVIIQKYYEYIITNRERLYNLESAALDLESESVSH